MSEQQLLDRPDLNQMPQMTAHASHPASLWSWLSR
jgi:hypothetical protein